jgi:CRP/FNR family transcriptional regulator, cyclic AMP receptor protein
MLIGIAAIESRVPAGPHAPAGTFALETTVTPGTVCQEMGATASSGAAPRAASLFDIDPELAEGLDARRRAEARTRAIVPIVDLPPGPFSPAQLSESAVRPFALMVVDGLVLRELLLAGSAATELLGPCDIVALSLSDDALLPTQVAWSVPQGARVAILDDRIVQIIRTWPTVGRLLVERAARREARLATHRAITQLPRVDQRLLAFFAHLAERWGRVGANGVAMPLHLTHETLGRLIGARRPTVSLAFKDLAADDLLRRRDDGAWVLSYAAFERLGCESAIPAGWQPADARPIAVPDGNGGAVPASPAKRPQLTAGDIAALRARVEHLRSQHPTRLSRAAVIIERSRQTRRGLDRNGARAGW